MGNEDGVCTGFSLLELSIAIAISSILFLLIMQIYVSVKQHNQFQQANSDRLERARIANYILTKAIRQAGFLGCPAVLHYPELSQGNASLLLPHGNQDEQMFKVYQAIGQGWQPILPAGLQGKVKVGTDVIKVQRLGPSLASVRQDMKNDKQVLVSAEFHFEVGDTVVISDCGQGESFKISRLSLLGDQIMLTSISPLSYRYQQYAAVGQIETQFFYIRQSAPLLSEREVFSLYLYDGSAVHTELVAGIDDMSAQIVNNKFGEKSLVSVIFNITSLALGQVKVDKLATDVWQTMVALR